MSFVTNGFFNMGGYSYAKFQRLLISGSLKSHIFGKSLSDPVIGPVWPRGWVEV